MKQKASDKRLEAFTKSAQEKILYKGYDSRVMIATIIDDLKPEKLIIGRRCVGSEKVVNKKTGQPETKLKYKITRRFIEFENKERLSVDTSIFNHLKTDHKIECCFENYYA
jgi:hypothetical protein